ncbi:heavy-metal-associated domain-containing protein [Mycoplasmatota bacterium]|nr:heavy-metal-associated domain-containing protein [Mycoplasmatota bacterium]
MKKVYIKGICCKGCKKQLENIFNNIYGIKNAVVSQDDCSITYDGYVSERVIEQALKGTDYEIEKFDIEHKK